MPSLAPASVSHPSPIADAARVAEIGYTAVIDRFTPALTFADVDANVRRSVGGGGGAPADIPELRDVLPRAWRAGAVSVFEEARTSGPLGAPGPVAFAITAEASGARAAIATTAVLHEPSDRLRSDAAVLSAALRAALERVAAGVPAAAVAAAFHDGIDGSALAGRCGDAVGVALEARAGLLLAPDAADALQDGEVVFVGSHAQTDAGVIAFGTTVLVTPAGAVRLDGVPLRLIELR